MTQEANTSTSGLDTSTEHALDAMFRDARTHRNWTSTPVSIQTLRDIYETMKFGPTSANASPMRIVFLTNPEAIERLIPAMAEGNVDKTRSAPAVAIFAYDEKFFERMDYLMPGRDIKAFFAGNPDAAAKTAAQSATLQAAYFMIVARAYGIDCGPMGGFDGGKVNELFFPDSSWKVNFICNLGHGDPSTLQPRLPRLDFDEVCQVY